MITGLLLALTSSMVFGQAQDTQAARPDESEQDASGATGLQIHEGWHVVRPGDTLEKISKKYLGAAIRWSENWKLNPEISNPHRIFPGQRLRILLPGTMPRDGALVFKISRKVENQLLPLSWQDAHLNDLLQSRDSLRTFDGASAELWFFDDTHLVLSESSLVLIGNDTKSLQPQDPTKIEVVLGQADLSGVLSADSDDSIEIVMGKTIAQPKAGPEGDVETRARRPEGGGAQLMVYRGESALESAGTRIDVPQGMGSAVADGKPPGPPEKLLPAASVLEPPDGTLTDDRNPEFRWLAVDGAATYTVEVCLDARCGLLEARQVGITNTVWQSEADLPFGELLWRVTAVSPSGLDGFPSEPRRLEITDRPLDRQPPRISWQITEPKALIDGRLIVGPGFELEVEIEDSSGVESWTPILDGQQTTLEALYGDLGSGDHSLAIRAIDKAGNKGQSADLPFFFDPDPPTLSWGVETVGTLGSDLVDRFSEEGPEATYQGRQQLHLARKAWNLRSDFTQVVVRSARRKIRLREMPEYRITREQGLWVLAEDRPCKGVSHLAYDLQARNHTDSRRAAPVLVVDATDCVGNRTRIAWPLLLGRR